MTKRMLQPGDGINFTALGLPCEALVREVDGDKIRLSAKNLVPVDELFTVKGNKMIDEQGYEFEITRVNSAAEIDSLELAKRYAMVRDKVQSDGEIDIDKLLESLEKNQAGMMRIAQAILCERDFTTFQKARMITIVLEKEFTDEELELLLMSTVPPSAYGLSGISQVLGGMSGRVLGVAIPVTGSFLGDFGKTRH